MNIFVVEDSSLLRRLVVRRLEEMPGMHVIGEAGGEDSAFSLIRGTQPDVVLTDLSLVRGSGLGLVQRLRTDGFAGHIAVLTAQNLDPVRRACMDAGASAFHDKAGGLETLFDELAALHSPAAATMAS